MPGDGTETERPAIVIILRSRQYTSRQGKVHATQRQPPLVVGVCLLSLVLAVLRTLWQ